MRLFKRTSKILNEILPAFNLKFYTFIIIIIVMLKKFSLQLYNFINYK